MPILAGSDPAGALHQSSMATQAWHRALPPPPHDKQPLQIPGQAQPLGDVTLWPCQNILEAQSIVLMEVERGVCVL